MRTSAIHFFTSALFIASVFLSPFAALGAPLEKNTPRVVRVERDSDVEFRANDGSLRALFHEAGLPLGRGAFEIMEAKGQFFIPFKKTDFSASFFLNQKLFKELYPNDDIKVLSQNPFRLQLKIQKPLFQVSSKLVSYFYTEEQIAKFPNLQRIFLERKRSYPIKGILVQYGYDFTFVFSGAVTLSVVYDLKEKGTLFENIMIAGVTEEIINYLGNLEFLQNLARSRVESEVKADMENLVNLMRRKP